MINFPEIELKDEKILVIIFIITLLLFFFNYLDIKVLVSILVIIFIINHYSTLKKNINENIINKDKKSKLPLRYNHKISKLFIYFSINYDKIRNLRDISFFLEFICVRIISQDEEYISFEMVMT